MRKEEERLDLLLEFQRELEKKGVSCCKGEILANHTTFKIGGPAKLFCEPSDLEQLQMLILACKNVGMRYYLLGNGSNVLFSDAGYDGVVIHLGKNLSDISVKGNAITAMAGAHLGRLSRVAAQHSLTGLEFAVGIPGSVGGGVYMDAGAYGGEIQDVLTEVTFLDEEGQLRTLPADQLQLGYRTSIFAHKPWCLVQATFCLNNGDREESEAQMQDFMQRRKEKQPLEWPSAGSTFKRPQGAFAAALIEQCGLKGYQVGGAAVSEKHSGFVVNLGGATCADVVQLTEDVARVVQERTGFVLEREIRVVE